MQQPGQNDSLSKRGSRGQTLGVVGGGQLGRMLTREAVREGYRVVVFTDEYPPSPAGALADVEINAPYFDPEALADFASQVDVVTMEFENIPREFLDALKQRVPVYPDPEAIHICQSREREKEFLKKNKIAHAQYYVVDSPESLAKAVGKLGGDSMLKTAAFGYDGKGQVRLSGALDQDWGKIWKAFGASRGVLEKLIAFEREISVIGARGQDGQVALYQPVENRHVNQVLDLTIAPAPMSEEMKMQAYQLCQQVLEAFSYVGVLAVEMFVTLEREILVNEIAPRPHNSGHYTIDACHSNQFEQQLRAVTGMPLGSTEQHSPAVMLNLLGDSWREGQPPNWGAVNACEKAKLHLYGKKTAKPGRKMGHITLASADKSASAHSLVAEVEQLRRSLVE